MVSRATPHKKECWESSGRETIKMVLSFSKPVLPNLKVGENERLNFNVDSLSLLQFVIGSIEQPKPAIWSFRSALHLPYDRPGCEFQVFE